MKTEKKIGLTSEEVVENIKQFGTNQLSEKKRKSFFEFFKEAFLDKWILILILAMVIKIVFNLVSMKFGIGEVDWYDVISIFVAIMLSTGFSTYSNYSNESKFMKLKAEADIINVKTYRNNKLVEVNINELTIGDVVLLQSGDKVPFDGILLQGEVKVNQATLNGESEDAKKIVYDGTSELKNDDLFSKFMIFRGTVVSNGECLVKAQKIGDNTIIGSINTALQEERKQSPSELKLEKLASQIGVLGYSAGAIYFIMNIILGVMENKFATPNSSFLFVMQTIIYSVTIIIMAVPEGLPMMLSIVASMNSQKLLKENILVRNADTIETSGYSNVLFSDKTGTITNGVLSVVEIILGNGSIINELKNANPNLKENLVNALGLNNEANVSNKNIAVGSNSTDRALLNYLIKENLHEVDKSEIVSRESFSSATKFASVTLKNGNTYLKGASEVIFDKAKSFIDENGNILELNEEYKNILKEIQKDRAEKSMRILGLSLNEETFIGFVCIRDDVRNGMKDTVATLNNAGVQVVMVTGDRIETAKAISKEVGILKEGDLAITHDELEAMSDEELKQKLNKIKVVSRALPLDKKRLVDISHSLNNVGGMTGDGVNDSPALKSSDVGFSMGDGTETAKEASDIVILNNSLTSIEKAILFGRTMTKSVQKFIIFQLTVNVSVILVSLISPLFKWHEPFTIIQILWINLIMDTLAALAFGEEPALEEYMEEKPVAKHEPILTSYMKSQIGVVSLFIVSVIFGIYLNIGGLQDILIGEKNEPLLRTFIFTFFVYGIIFNSLNTRSKGLNLLANISKNKKFIYVMGGIAIMQSLLIQYGGKLFSTIPMDTKHFGYALGLAFLVIPIDFLRKKIFYKK